MWYVVRHEWRRINTKKSHANRFEWREVRGFKRNLLDNFPWIHSTEANLVFMRYIHAHAANTCMEFNMEIFSWFHNIFPKEKLSLQNVMFRLWFSPAFLCVLIKDARHRLLSESHSNWIVLSHLLGSTSKPFRQRQRRRVIFKSHQTVAVQYHIQRWRYS